MRRAKGQVPMYIHYAGRAVEASGWLRDDRPIPLLYAGDRGESAGDVAVIDGELVEWDGHAWIAPRRLSTARLG